MARNNNCTYSYEYNLSERLGNVRASFYQNPGTQQTEVIQRDDYYAFGLRKTSSLNSNTNKYLYNGKELQEELGQYDYSQINNFFSCVHELGSASVTAQGSMTR